MASESGPKFVTDGLVLCLDAANPRSYISGATVWNDLTYNISGGTLTNGPTFSSANGGSIVFDGVNDYVTLSSSRTTTTTFTYSCWLYPISSGVDYQTLFSQDANFGIWYRGISKKLTFFWLSGPYSGNHDSTQTLTENSWNNIVVINNGGNISFYINSILDNSTYIGGPSFNALIIGNDSINEIYTGRMSNIQLYNRALSAQEVLQNYNSTKSRFGL
jgi:hypothetical protein